MPKSIKDMMTIRMLIILASFATTSAVQSDINCLRSIKESLEDPENILSTWDFNNDTEGFICRFTGVECWSPDESKVLNIKLPHMGLRGPFPMGVSYCTSITGLDLSNNNLSGPLPSHINQILPFLTSLDLSNNNLSGPIPPTIANCSFINLLRLDNNHLTGQIPPELSQLPRIRYINISNNCLSGPVPSLEYVIVYANNLGTCEDEDHDDHLFLTGFAFGFPLFTILSTLFIMFFCSPTLSISNMLSSLLPVKNTKGRKRLLKSYHLLCDCDFNRQLTGMEKLIHRLNLEELQRATDDFHSKNVIGYGYMGLMYRAVFPNSLLLAVKRLHKFESFEKEFLTEIKILGALRHTNLISLIGFCFEMEKKFLVYKYMCNGTLHCWLHHRPQVKGNKLLEWSLRIKIAEGVARGLAWLHHNEVLRVAHLNISSKCILLDEKFEPRISNFGDAAILTNASVTPLSGCSFLVPDYSPYENDVYSFGILLLELVTGREPSTWINSQKDDVRGGEFNVIDECLTGQGFNEEIYETLRVAESCIQPHGHEATSMLQVYQAMQMISKKCNHS